VLALAAEQVGGAQRCLEMAVAYAKVRHQFGRVIGSFGPPLPEADEVMRFQRFAVTRTAGPVRS
jgi:acyl-CoA dehydrogenase-like protein